MKNEVRKMLIRISELEVLLGVSRSTIWRLRQQPHLGFPDPICIGSRLVGWKINDIEEWIDENKQQEVAA